MARVVILSTEDQADGFRLAGGSTHVARPGADAASALRDLIRATDVGVLLVSADLWQSLDERLRGELDRLPRPVVMAIPGAAPTARAGRIQLLGEMLQRAIGYRIQIAGGPEGDSPGAAGPTDPRLVPASSPGAPAGMTIGGGDPR